MNPRARLLFLVVILLIAVARAASATQEFYYYRDTTYTGVPSDARIGIQFDTTITRRGQAEFFSTHPCLDAGAQVTYLDRGFWVYGLNPSYGYEASATDLLSDETVHRVNPVYVSPTNPFGFAVSDLVNIQFDQELSRDSGLALLESHGLEYVDSNLFEHNLWVCALGDTITASPLGLGDSVHILPGVTWACAAQYATPVLMGAPTDPYYRFQYYLKDTGQFGGTPGVDIAAWKAWQIPLKDSSLLIAILDDGVVSHEDLPSARLLPGFDFAGDSIFRDCYPCPALPPDANPAPGQFEGHGMGCVGILAASHNSLGVAGICGSCRVLPVKILDNQGVAPKWQDQALAIITPAIRYAGQQGALVVSNSWAFPTTDPYPEVAYAIATTVQKYGCIEVFSAGNSADTNWDGPSLVNFPANMPEVIAVGAVKNTGKRWDYSCYGSALDVVAPSGNDRDGFGDASTASNLWTMDQMGLRGINPRHTGWDDAGGDTSYTSAFGGTSGACPQVAGIAALLLARGNDSITFGNRSSKIREIITSTAVQDQDSFPQGWNQYYGYGRANAFRAMLSIIRGDVNNSGHIDSQDVQELASYCFKVGAPPTLDQHVADTDCDGDADICDYLRTLAAVQQGATIPPCYRW